MTLICQEKTLRVSFYLLLNLAEDTKVEEKMKKKRIIYLLCSSLNRDHITSHCNYPTLMKLNPMTQQDLNWKYTYKYFKLSKSKFAPKHS